MSPRHPIRRAASGDRWTSAVLFIMAASLLLVYCGPEDAPGTPTASGATAPQASGSCGPLPATSHVESPPETVAKVDTGRRSKVGEAYQELWKHRAGVDGPEAGPATRAATVEDIGDIAVVRDEGDIILKPNLYDLRSTALRFSPNGSGGYDVTRSDRTFSTSVGDRLTLTDDDSVAVDLPVGFTYHGQRYTSVFVNSDGNLTFREADETSTDRDVARLLSGPPRIAPIFDDLDPSGTGGGVFRRAESDAVTITWCNVPEFGTTRRVNVQTRLNPGGSIDIVYGTVSATAAVVGLSPGQTGVFATVDLSSAGTLAGGTGAVGERFGTGLEVDFVALGRKFYQAHPDQYDQLVVWSNALTTLQAFAFEVTVANEISGIGVDQYDISRDFGSAGRLRSLVNMNALSRYPDDPRQRFLGENSTLSVLGQECGHRWLSFLQFRDGLNISSELLGRDQAHWSFFFDSDGSNMEGNDIEDLGNGVFRTTGAVNQYSALDQYAMGLRSASEVPPFYFVRAAQTTQGADRASAPRVGVEIRGTRKDVTIQDVVSAMGPRRPDAASSPKTFRQAFVYVVAQGSTESAFELGKLNAIREAWETYFRASTDGRGSVATRLQ